MELRSPETPWTAAIARRPVYLALDRDIACDVAVIGSGVSGALIGYRLIQAGINRVVMLDRRGVCQGSIGASTALLQYELDTPLTELITQIGRPAAERAYQLCRSTLNEFADLVAGLDRDCAFRHRNSLYLSGSTLNAVQIQAEGEARRRIGIDVRYLDRTTLRRLSDIDRPAALLSAKAAEVDPCAMTIALIENAVAQGMRVYSGTAVIDYKPHATGITLGTDGGHQVRARHVVFATGYETQAFLDQHSVRLKTTFALASEPVTDFGAWGRPGMDRCLIWEASDPYFYARTTADNRILIGGEDVPTIDPAERDAVMSAKEHALIHKFNTLFPGIAFKTARRWAGVFATTDDGLPYIGAHPRFPGAYFALGYGGNGITFALLAANLIRDQLAGLANPDMQLFRFDRTPTHTRAAS